MRCTRRPPSSPLFAALMLVLLTGMASAQSAHARPGVFGQGSNHGFTASVRFLAAGNGATESFGPSPLLSFTVSSFRVAAGRSIMLFWTSSNTTSCTASGAWSGAKATRGEQTLTPVHSGAYILTCRGSGGSVTRSVTVEIIRG